MNKKQMIGCVLLLGGGLFAVIMGLNVSHKNNQQKEILPAGIVMPSEKNEIPTHESAELVELQELKELKADDGTTHRQQPAVQSTEVTPHADQTQSQKHQEQQLVVQDRLKYQQILEDEKKRQQALEAKRKLEQEERKRQQALEAKRKLEQEERKRQQALEAKRKLEQEERKRQQALEAKRKLEQEERKRQQALEAKRKLEQEERKRQQALEAKQDKQAKQDKRQWMVQISLANDQESANKQIAQLRANGYKVITSPTSKGIRVMVGPHKDKAAAEATRKKIVANSQLNMKSAWVNGWIPLKDR